MMPTSCSSTAGNRDPVADGDPPARIALLDEMCGWLSAHRTPAQCNEGQASVLTDDAAGNEAIVPMGPKSVWKRSV